MPDKLSRREREKIRHRREMIEAAKKLFALKGFRGTTLDEIAEEAEFGKGTLYNYFENKEDIYVETLASVFIAVAEIVAKVDAEAKDFCGFIRSHTMSMVRYAVDDPYGSALFGQRAAHEELAKSPEATGRLMRHIKTIREVMTRRFTDARAAGELRRDLPIDQLISFYRHAFHCFLGEHGAFTAHSRSETPIGELAEVVLTIFLNGALNRPTREES